MSYLEIARAAQRRTQARRELDQPVPPLDNPAAEARRLRLVTKLREHPELTYAIETAQLDDGSHIIALAIPGATCELTVPVPRDPFEFMRDAINLMDKSSQREKSEVSEKRGERPSRVRAGYAASEFAGKFHTNGDPELPALKRTK